MDFDQIGRNLPALLSAVFLAILFIQSGLDKVLDWRGNLEFLSGHFSKTFLARFVPVLMATITVLELAAGLLAAVGVLYFLIDRSTILIFYSAVTAAVALISLFMGQRLAKDYPGAAVLVPYFILVLILIYLTNPTVPR